MRCGRDRLGRARSGQAWWGGVGFGKEARYADFLWVGSGKVWLGPVRLGHLPCVSIDVGSNTWPVY